MKKKGFEAWFREQIYDSRKINQHEWGGFTFKEIKHLYCKITNVNLEEYKAIYKVLKARQTCTTKRNQKEIICPK